MSMYFKQIFDERCGYTSRLIGLGSLAVTIALVFGLILAATPAHAATTFTVQFFRNPAGTDEGRRFIGQKWNVSTDASGGATFTFRPVEKVNAGLAITATATDPEGNTSEFSDPETVG